MNKKYFFVSIVFLGLIILGCTPKKLNLDQQLDNNENANKVSVNTPDVSNDNQQSTSQVKNWQTFQNNYVGYSIKAPQGFIQSNQHTIESDNSKLIIQIYQLHNTVVKNYATFNQNIKQYYPHPESVPDVQVVKLGDFINRQHYVDNIGPGGAAQEFYAIDPAGEFYYNISVSEPGYTENKELAMEIIKTFVVLSDQGDAVNKRNWGVSFVILDGWQIVSNNSQDIIFQQIAGENKGDKITISYLIGDSITDDDSKFGPVTYFFDNINNQWLEKGRINEMTGIIEPAAVKAGVVRYVANNFPVFSGTSRWKTYIMPLSVDSFLKFNIVGSGATRSLDDLLDTVKLSD